MKDDITSLLEILEEIKSEPDIGRKAELLAIINSQLPGHLKLEIPSLITNDYINFAVYKLEERLLVA